MSETKNPLEDFVTPERAQKFEQVASQRTRNLTVVLDRIRNYHNISAVIRSADAFGVNDIHLVGSRFEYTKGISKGTERWIDLHHKEHAEDMCKTLKEKGFSLVVLQPEVRNSPYAHLTHLPVFSLPFEEKLALVFGNEKHGVSEVFMQEATYGASIPMYGFVDSFNISVACAITLFCSTISNAEAGRRVTPIGEKEKSELKDRWLRDNVKNADRILSEISDRLEKPK